MSEKKERIKNTTNPFEHGDSDTLREMFVNLLTTKAERIKTEIKRKIKGF
jgi:hypothetical protein